MKQSTLPWPLARRKANEHATQEEDARPRDALVSPLEALHSIPQTELEAQQMSAGQKLPQRPEPGGYFDREGDWVILGHTNGAMDEYGLQCFEAGRQQGMLPKPSKLDRECLRLGQEIQRAAGELPPGWNIEIDVERGAGSVTLIDPECERTYFNDMVDGMSHALSAAIAAATPVQQGPMGREGCNYMCMPGKVCRKCGHVHDIPLTVPPVQQGPDICGTCDGRGCPVCKPEPNPHAAPPAPAVEPSPREIRLRAAMERMDTIGPLPGMIAAFETQFGQTWTDPDWRQEASVWASAWRAAKTHEKRDPLTPHQISDAAREAQIAFCLDKQANFEVALTRAIEKAHGVGGAFTELGATIAARTAHGTPPADAKESGK